MVESIKTLVTIALICALAHGIAQTRYGRYLSAPAIIIVLGVIAGEIGLIPREQPIYGLIASYVVPMSIALLLAHADLRSLWREVGVLLGYFALAAATVMVGGILAANLLPGTSPWVQFVPVFVATYIGGSLNLISTAEIMGVSGSPEMAAALAVDAIIGITYLLMLSLASGLMESGETTISGAVDQIAAAPPAPRVSMRFAGAVLALCYAALATGAAFMFSNFVGQEKYLYLALIILAVGIANLFPGWMQALPDAPGIGLVGMYSFFAVIGASTPIAALDGALQTGIVVAAVIVGVHVALFFPIARLFGARFDLILTLSNASVLGPATAAAMASARQWPRMVVVGTLCGVLGYVIANFLALLVMAMI